METPLANLLRPQTISEIVGQERLLQPDGLIKRMVDQQFTSNLIFYGPPGVGKTSFASALAHDLHREPFFFNAAIDKKEKLDRILNTVTDHTKIIIIDEVHRMNQNKQDLLLEHMETGAVICYFTTTENPYFTINPAIRSRATILELTPISSEDIFNFFKAQIKTGRLKLTIQDEPLRALAQMSGGDLRVALNKAELLLRLYPDEPIDLNLIQRIFDSKANLSGSKAGDTIYDLKSALQKSVRGSDVDAALYWFARMLEGGDYEALLRRMTIMAYEDIGMANPAIPVHVFTACEAFRQVGMPEGIIPLGLAIVEMSLSEKSNSAYLATLAAQKAVQDGKIFDIPVYLKDAHYSSAKKLQRGVGYKYPHNYENDWVAQDYLPKEMLGTKFYQAKDFPKYEKRINDLYREFTKKKN